jgi:hypothetical protein
MSKLITLITRPIYFHRKKNYEAQFLIDIVLNDKIEKKNNTKNNLSQLKSTH